MEYLICGCIGYGLGCLNPAYFIFKWKHQDIRKGNSHPAIFKRLYSEEEQGRMNENRKRTITVLLTRYCSTFSNFIYWVTGRGYTHASLALNDGEEFFYSFNFKGFRHEYPGRHIHKCVKSICYKLEVSEEAFEKIRKQIEEMEQNREKLHYSRLGVLLCLLHIPFKMENGYFCSQFVMEMLQLSGSIVLEKSPSLYLPNQLPEILGRCGCLKEIICNPV
ncbi:MAG: hypothetical protein J5988_05110 [Eubacterium sp.]|nr:hypothetical protein [Eubacterium sp.]